MHPCVRNQNDEKEDLERLYKGPQQNTDGVTLSQQLDQPGRTEKLQETHVDGVHRLGQAHKWMERGCGREGESGRQKGGTGWETQMAKIITT